MSALIYLDHNATTPVEPRVFEAMRPWLESGFGNPSSVYSLGRAARAAITAAREQVAALLDASPSEILFTSGGTESINTAIQSALALDPDRYKIITSAVEHSATLKLCAHLARKGWQVITLPVDSQGLLDLEALRKALDPDTAIVSLLWANNETGVLFPIEEVAALCAEHRVPLHVDAVQAIGKIPVSTRLPGLSFLSLSGHKLHAPKGIGALFVSRAIKFQPLLRGSQENERRGGTENVASIVALGTAAQLARAEWLPREQSHVRSLRDAFERGLLERIPGARRNGHPELRLPNTSNITFPGLDAEAALMLLDSKGLCCSAGSACTSGSVSPSHVLTAMGLSGEDARSSLRFSFGIRNTPEEIPRAIDLTAWAWEKWRAESTRLAPARTAA